MIENEILKLLKTISLQLDHISKCQTDIMSEISSLYQELANFQEYTQKLEEKIPRKLSPLLN